MSVRQEETAAPLRGMRESNPLNLVLQTSAFTIQPKPHLEFELKFEEAVQAFGTNPRTVSSSSKLNFPPWRKIVGWAGIEPALYGVTIRCHTLWLPTHFAKQNPSSLTLQLTLTIIDAV
jgi:hypothetical protein